MLMTDVFIIEKLDYTMLAKNIMGIIVLVSMVIVSFTVLVVTDVIDVNVFGETFFTGLEETLELGTQMQSRLEGKIGMTFYP